MAKHIVHGNPVFNPQAQKSMRANAGLSPISQDKITETFIRQAFENSLFNQVSDPIVERWNEEKRRFHQQTPYIEASTLMPLVTTPQGLEMLLTRRSLQLKKHSGQISFPGGRVDKEDTSAAHTALRETFEEIGVPAQKIHLVGQLPDFFTGTGFLIRPFVAFVDAGYTLLPNQDEVAEVFSVPLSFLLNPENHFLHEVPIGLATIREYYSIPWKDYFIWGATAAVIRTFYQRLHSLQNLQHKPEKLFYVFK